MNGLAVDQFPERYASAVFAKDVDALLGLYNSEVQLFDLWGVWAYDGALSWRRAVTDWFASLGEQRVGVGFDHIRMTVADNLATLHAIITYREIGPDGVQQGSMQNRLTWVLKRFDNNWEIAHEHTSAPVDFETSKVILQRA